MRDRLFFSFEALRPHRSLQWDRRDPRSNEGARTILKHLQGTMEKGDATIRSSGRQWAGRRGVVRPFLAALPRGRRLCRSLCFRTSSLNEKVVEQRADVGIFRARTAAIPEESSEGDQGTLMGEPARRILVITRNFPPLWGGMERLNWHLADQLARYAQVHLIAPMGAREKAPPGVQVIEAPLRPLGRFLLVAALRSLAEARRFRPHFVLAGSGLTSPIALAAARLVNGKAGAYVHGLDLALPHPIYRTVWFSAMRRLDRVIANSRATATLAQAAGIQEARLSIVHPGVELAGVDQTVQQARRRAFRKKYELGERPILLSVGRLTSRKGIKAFVREVLHRVVQCRPDCFLLIVGDAPCDALAAKAETPQAILEEARAMRLEQHVRWLGVLFGEDLESAYCAADVHVFPVREIRGDPEGFGMVAIEAAAHGLPTVAYATGGVVDAVADGVSGRLVPPGDAESFAAAVLDLLQHPLERQGIRRFAEGFAWDSFGARLAVALA